MWCVCDSVHVDALLSTHNHSRTMYTVDNFVCVCVCVCVCVSVYVCMCVSVNTLYYTKHSNSFQLVLHPFKFDLARLCTERTVLRSAQ